MTTSRLFVCGMTADVPVRIQLMEALLESLTELAGYERIVGLHWHVNTDWRNGGLQPVRKMWRAAVQLAREAGATHMVPLCEDMILHPDFFVALEHLAEARPGALVDCHVNHPLAGGLDTVGFMTTEGATLLGGVIPVEFVEEWLHWDDQNEAVLVDYPIDARFCLWAMATARLIYKPLPALVDHDLTVPSIQGNQHQTDTGSTVRHSIGFDAGTPWDLTRDHAADVPNLGRTYQSNHLALLERLAPPMIERYFDVERGHGLPSGPSLFIAAPAYRGEVKSDWVIALMREILFLKESKVDVSLNFKSDSLINRARNRLLSDFLASDASHCLFWDTDNFPTKTGWAANLMATGHGLVGGAVVLKDGKGDKFNVRFGGTGELRLEMINGCVPMSVVGTGFLMVTRAAVLKMCQAYHETAYYRAGAWMDMPGRAEWALFADVVRDQDHLSEDYEFCARWRDLGGQVYVQPDIDFVHIGEQPYEGSFRKTFFAKGDKDADQT